MKTSRILIAALTAVALTACSGGGDSAQTEPSTTADPVARVFIISPEDGSTQTSPVTVTFGIAEFSVAPAGTQEPNTGHHHLLVDTGLPALDQPVPADANHIHFGKGQTETTLELAPGEHTLQLLLGDGSHIPHNPPLISEPVTITITN